MSNISTMPIPELVKEIRAKTTKMDSDNLATILVLNILAARLEKQHRVVTVLLEFLDGTLAQEEFLLQHPELKGLWGDE